MTKHDDVSYERLGVSPGCCQYITDYQDIELRKIQKRELGPYAFEKCMPSSIATILTNENSENKISNVIPKLAQLLECDQAVETAYLCHPSVIQVTKLADEGNTFCAYRNLQMLLSSLPTVHETLKQQDSTVPALQEMIEKAWDAGFNSHGRTQTGGIKGTRKYVGSSEVEALMLYLGIQCTGQVFDGSEAHVDLLNAVEKYYLTSQTPTHSATSPIAKHNKIQLTSRPPIFLQRPKHSVTIVGLEKIKNGKRRLLVFDPAWQPPSIMRQSGLLPTPFVESRFSRTATLWKYRKSGRYLQRFAAFEMVSLDLNINEQTSTVPQRCEESTLCFCLDKTSEIAV